MGSREGVSPNHSIALDSSFVIEAHSKITVFNAFFWILDDKRNDPKGEYGSKLSNGKWLE